MNVSWKSVKDGLPEEDGSYLVATNMTGKSKGVTTLWLCTTTVRGKKIRRWKFWGGKIFNLEVKYWANLPEPPEE